MSASTRTRPCPCGTAQGYDVCCGRLHRGEAAADTAEQLMRSRYAAFVVGATSYLLASWHPATRPETLDLDDSVRWTGLEVLRTEAGQVGDRRGLVEFRAHHEHDGVPGTLHEISQFRRDAQGWQYVRGRASWS